MKKVMVGILVLIPIIILITVGAVSTFVTTRAHIAVEEIYFDFPEGEEKQITLEFGNEYYSLDKHLSVVVLPERATDTSFTWRIDDLVCYDGDYNAKWSKGEVDAPAMLVDESDNAVEENSTGRIKINSYCYFNVYVQAETMTDKCLVYVGGSDVKSVSVKGVKSMTVGEIKLFDAVLSPIDALVGSLVWASSNPAVAVVDGNGAVSAKSAGKTNITVTALGKNEDEATSSEFEVTVSGGVTAFGSKVVLGSNSISLAALNVSSAVTSYVNCSVVGTDLVITDPSAEATITTAAGTATITVVGAEDIAIKNADIYSFDASKDDNYILAVGDVVLALDVIFARSDATTVPTASEIQWTSSAPSVATVSGGKVTGVSSGVSTITANYGGKTADIVLAVENKITNLILKTTDASLAVGIARETVFASRAYKNVNTAEYKNNGFEIQFLRPTCEAGMEDVFYSAFDFSVKDVTDGTEKDTDKAYFENNVIFFDASKISETTLLKVTVSAKYPKYSHLASYTAKSFTLKVVDGVAVGTDAELIKAGETNTTAVLYNNIFMTNPGGLDNKRDVMIESSFSIYGNNYTVSSKAEQFLKRDSMMFLLHGDDSIVSNLKIKLNEDIGDEISNGDEDMDILLGIGIRFEGTKRELGDDTPLDSFRMEYTIIENCRTCVNVLAAAVYFEGNIMRNCLEMAIWAPTDIDSWGGGGVRFFDITLKNNVFSNLISLSYSFTYSGYSDNAKYEQAMREGKNSKLEVIGFLDIYNWQELNVLSMVPLDAVGDDLASYIPLINSVLREEMTSGEFFAKYRYGYNGITYFHMGGMGTGLIEPCYLNFARNDEARLKEFTNENFNSGNLAILGGLELTRVWCYTNEVKDIIPQKTYSVNSKLIDHLHGIGVVYPEGTPEYEVANA